MHLIANRLSLSLLCKKSFGIIGRVDQCSSSRSIGEITPVQFCILPIKILDPDASQRLDRRNLTQKDWSGIRKKSIKQFHPIFSDDDGIGETPLFAIWETIVFDTVLVSLDPNLLPLLFEPLGSHHSQTIQGCPKGFSDSFHAVE